MRTCIGLLTHCDSQESPERFKILEECVASLKMVKRDDVFIHLWDNMSSDTVKEFLKKQDFIDEYNFSDRNLYDLVAMHYLIKKAESLGCEFVIHLEDDFLFYDEDFLDDAYEFMDKNKDCGYLRLVKYEYGDKQKYTKDSSHPKPDKANWQRHFNVITEETLRWEDCGLIGNHRFYKNNWHWHNFIGLTRVDVFKQLVPQCDHHPLQPLEGEMMVRYANLGYKVGILNGGVATHLGEFNTKTSARLAKIAKAKGRSHPLIKMSDVIEEIEKMEESQKKMII